MKYSAWHIIAFLFTLIGILAILFVVGISFFFHRFNVNQVVNDKITDLELISNTIAGPSWTVKESYPGTIENTFRGVLKMPGVKFIRLISSESNIIEKSGNIDEVNNVNIDNLPLFSRDVSVRDGTLDGELIKEFSIKTRDGSDLWMGVSLINVKKNILFSAVLMGIVAMVLMTITIMVVFLLVRYVFMSPLAVLMSAFGKLKNSDYDVQLGKARIIEMQEVFDSFNQMVAKVKEAEVKLAEELKRAKEIDRMKSEFISVAAHQLRTPLSAVKWTMKMLIDGDIGHLTHEQRTFLMQGYISNERIINLVNDLLNVARIEEGRFGYKFAMIQIEDLIESIVLDIKHKVKEKELDFKFERSGLPKPPKIKIDPS
ncbi:MAG TPA: hypothetical protein ENG89_00340 [Candidatus Moranbacteria bacterium]|nr:hypothetical protein [Candidatus Moranbacteria bacterium]